MAIPSDSLIAAAVAKRDAALAEAERWNAWIKAAQELAGSLPPERPAVTIGGGYILMRPDPPLAHAGSGSAVGARVLETEAAVAAIIREAGKPVPTKEIFEILAKRGFEIAGKDPLATLTTRLTRAPTLENHKPYGWRLKEPRPEVGAGGEAVAAEPPSSDPDQPNSDPVEPVVGGGG